jgi:hypothetical protein
MADRRTALFWTIGWWFARRYMRRRAAIAAAGVASAAAARRGRLAGVAGALAVVGLLVGAFLAWRKLFARDDATSERFYSPASVEGEPVAAEGPVAPAGADAA